MSPLPCPRTPGQGTPRLPCLPVGPAVVASAAWSSEPPRDRGRREGPRSTRALFALRERDSAGASLQIRRDGRAGPGWAAPGSNPGERPGLGLGWGEVPSVRGEGCTKVPTTFPADCSVLIVENEPIQAIDLGCILAGFGCRVIGP